MTDLERYPDARPAAWSSGRPVEAASGASFLPDGRLAVAALRGAEAAAHDVRATGRVVAVPAELDGTLRSAAGRPHRARRRAAGVDVQRRRRPGAAGVRPPDDVGSAQAAPRGDFAEASGTTQGQ